MLHRAVGRYLVCDEIASGGAATVHLGRARGPHGFARTVAIKALHPPLATDPDVVRMFIDEARLSARIRHPNVVPTIDVVEDGRTLLLVMEYVHGEPISALARSLRGRGESFPQRIAATLVHDMLLGLHAAHEAKDDHGVPLDIVHRDVSPQNVLVGVDGVARVVDFGVAKATGRLQTTSDGQIKGKISYMAPEQLRGREIDRRADVYAAGVTLWEMLTGRRLFTADSPPAVMTLVLEKPIGAPSREAVPTAPPIAPELDALVLRALSRDRDARFPTAEAMAEALAAITPREPASVIAAWVESVAASALEQRARMVERVERLSPADASFVGVDGVLSDEPKTVTQMPRRDGDARAPRRHGRVLGAAGAACAVLALVGAYQAGAHGNAPGAAGPGQTATTSVASATATTSVASATASTSTTSAMMPAPGAASPMLSVASAAPLTAPVTAAAPAPPLARAHAATPRTPGGARRDTACTPAYTVDAAGFHIPKPECL